MSKFQPLLGAVVTDLNKVRYPTFASTKLDGIRGLRYGPEWMSRTLKTIPNRQVQRLFKGLDIPQGLDGEFIFGEPNAPDVYRKTNSFLMRHDESVGLDQVRFFAFDNYEAEGPFYKRIETVQDIPPYVVKLDQVLIDHPDDLLEFELKTLAAGYEGVVLRHPEGAYKFGRSTLREQYLLKLKRFTDAEATVIGFEELLHNANEADRDERGYVKRSSHQENLVPMGMLGALIVSMGSLEFRIGTGFTEHDRRTIWLNRDKYLGALAKFKYFAVGIKNLPRHPVFLGWRSVIDT